MRNICLKTHKNGHRASDLKFLLLCLIFLCSMSAWAQERVIRGTVVDETNEPVIGATVMATGAGTTNGVITDLEGNFVLAVPEKGVSIDVSYLGYKTQQISIKGKSTVYVKLNDQAIDLDEVVVIGYGTAKRGNLTGAIAKVDAERLEERPMSNIASSLQGALAGVEIRANSGVPGEELAIRVRGAASINAEATPLYVVDGIPQDDLSSINPADIQSIEVLKDASSSAIYGSRGSNGVILITTKTALPSEKVNVQFSAAFSIQQLERKVDVLSPQEWIDFRTAYNNANYIASYAGKGATVEDDWDARVAIMGKVSYSYLNDPRWTEPNHGSLALIDWQDKIFRTALMQNYQTSLSSGGKATNYRVSLGYLNQEGVVIETDFKRLTLRSNVESKVFDKITVGLNVAPTVSWKNGASVDGKDKSANLSLSMCPIAEPEAGVYTSSEPYERYLWAGSTVSPVATLEQTKDRTEAMRVNTSAYIKADLMRGLRAEITGSYNFSSTQRRRFIPSSISSKWSVGEGYHTSALRTESRSHKYLFQTVLNYNETFGNHTIAGVLGFSMESSDGSSSSLSAQQFPDNSLEIFDMSDQVLTGASASLTNPVRMLSYFGRIQYEYDNRYLLNISVRRDGSSKFGRNNRWGTFPAVSAAYRISNEKFWPADILLNQLKVRASWGLNGNNRISDTAALGLVSSANYSLSGALTNGFATTSIENDMLGWEKTTSWNLGLDMGFFNNRIAVTVDYYEKTTKDLLYQISTPAIMGFSKAWGNVGNIKNKGMELEVTSYNLNGVLKWNTSFNMSYNKNKVISLGKDNTTIYTGWSTSNTQVLMVGQPLRSYYMYDAVGVYQTQEDLRKYPLMANTTVGDVRYRDVDRNGIIDDNDRTLVGKPDPDYTFGMTNTLKYKLFDLSIVMTAQRGGQIYSILGRSIDRPGMGASNNVLSKWKNMWLSEEQPGDGKTPGITNSNTGSLYDTRWLYSTDFFKIKNVTLGYRFNTKKSKYVRSARLYLSGENLWMWDKYDGGFSPEANNGGSTASYDYGSYPLARIFTLGISISLR